MFLFLVRLMASATMVIGGIFVLFYPDKYWQLWVYGYKMQGFKPDTLERNSAWDCQRLILGLLSLILGILGLVVWAFAGQG